MLTETFIRFNQICTWKFNYITFPQPFHAFLCCNGSVCVHAAIVAPSSLSGLPLHAHFDNICGLGTENSQSPSGDAC